MKASYLTVFAAAAAFGFVDMSGRWEDLAYEHVAAFLDNFQAVLSALAVWFVAWLRTRSKDKQIEELSARIAELVKMANSLAKALQRAERRENVDLHSLCQAESGNVPTESGRFPSGYQLLDGIDETVIRGIQDTGSITPEDVKAARAEHERRRLFARGK